MSLVLAYGLTQFLFVANDLLFWLTSEHYAIYFADYAVKLAMLALMLAAGVHRLADPRPERPLRPAVFAAWFVFAVAANLVIFDTVDWTRRELPTPYLFTWPRIEIVWLRALDFTAGLALTAVVEEMMARRLAWHVLAPRFAAPWAPLAVSSLLFGLGHWGDGPWNTIGATLGGAALFLAYRRTGSLTLVIVAHFLANVILFAQKY
jgi:membrane protease YdiL (CAAX protease family)